jgi:CubicO group peptidase (beta-lactamase class C family)
MKRSRSIHRHAFAILTLLAILALCSLGNASGSGLRALTPEQTSTVDRYVTNEIRRQQIPGAEVGIYDRGKILLAKGYGLADVELNVPVRPETVFQSGSVGKQFVSAAIMMLVEEGKIGLDDSIKKYFPDGPHSWSAIRVRNLLSHTSGLSEYESPDRVGPDGPFYLRLDFTEDELVTKIEAMPIEWLPGEKWAYRNTNYVLLGAIIHKVSGRFYADYLHKRIFEPLGMTHTRLISEADIIPNRSSGYELHRGVLKNQEWVSPTFNSTADGALYFNVLDLSKWDAALYGTSLLKQSSLDRIWTVYPLNDGKPNPANYGFGWEINATNGHKLIEHSGEWQGFTCHIARYVDDNLTVTVLTNLAAADPELIAHVVAGLVNPALMPPKLNTITDDQPQIAEHLRTFLDELSDGDDVKDELGPDLAAYITADTAADIAASVRPVWPSDSIALLSRKEQDDVTLSRYRVSKEGETRIVAIGFSTDGKIAAFRVEPDPDAR